MTVGPGITSGFLCDRAVGPEKTNSPFRNIAFIISFLGEKVNNKCLKKCKTCKKKGGGFCKKYTKFAHVRSHARSEILKNNILLQNFKIFLNFS